jgi:hypothetical protein
MFLMALTMVAVEPPPRPMEVEMVRDPITDHVRAYATIREGGDRLVVSCDSSTYDGPRVTFHARHWLARGNLLSGDRSVTWRFDDHPPRRRMWNVGDRRAVLTDRARVTSFLAWMMASRKLAIRTRDIENHRYDITFRLVDVRPAIEQALAACGQEIRQPS